MASTTTQLSKYRFWKFVLWLGVLLLWAFWVVMLGGIAALQANCNGGDQSLNLVRIGRAVGTLFPHYHCTSLYRWQWWTTFYSFTVLVLLTLALATGFVASARSALICLLAINVVLQMYECNTFFYLREVVTRYGYTDLLVRGRVFFAGCVVHAGVGFSFIIALGSGTEQTLERVFQWRARRDAKKVAQGTASHNTTGGGRVVVDEQTI